MIREGLQILVRNSEGRQVLSLADYRCGGFLNPRFYHLLWIYGTRQSHVLNAAARRDVLELVEAAKSRGMSVEYRRAA